ncbi:hypothetical protein PENTCL1PPCAC_19323 [Pristionchus entomophagus]|uniref:ADP ribosylation factor n=1 Tax=Pristionchus entomophagus TaxID=358040 RepID=A0AAV5TSE4_9BILA|nr:hypothetical protein PENTCL1PPCAC_19323 [Pristionchus entomophagus]
MGILYSSCVPNRDCKIVIMGLEGGGKTSIINWMREGKALEEPPQVTYSFNYFECSKFGYNMKMFDIGGTDRKTTFWRHFLSGAHGLIYVVDSSNFTRLSEAREQLHKILGFEAMHGVRTLILANKMDLQDRKICQVASVELIRKELGLDNSFHQWCIEPCSAVTGEGIMTGLRWAVQGV